MPVVQLRCASLPFIFGFFADHYWFVVSEEGSPACHRWEVWQTKNAGGTSVGYVHCDLRHPDAGVGGGPTRITAEWRGAEASAVRDVLERPEEYPHCQRYHYWPGPNSNTFAAWVLRRAGIDHRFDGRAVGCAYGCED
jgi:hypothetical protein